MEFRLKRILPVLLGLTFLWVIFLLSRFLLQEKANNNGNYVPENSSLVLRIDGKSFLENAAYDLGYKSQDDNIFKQLEILSSRNTKRSEFRDAGIDFLSDVVAFSQAVETANVQGLIFNLSDPERFRATMSDLISENQSFAVKGDVGILLVASDKFFSKQELRKHAEKLLAAESKTGRAQKSTNKPGTFANINVKNHSGLAAGNISASLSGSRLGLSGNLHLSEQQVFSSKSLKPDGFHLSTIVFNQQIQDSLKSLLHSKGFNLPEINRVSVNYRGTNIENGAMPLADLLLEFETEISFEQISRTADNFKNFGFTVSPISPSSFELQLGNIKYALVLIDHRTIFMGQNLGNILNTQNNHLFQMKGDLSRITQIEGGGLLGMGINLFPPYKAGKAFSESISKADIQIVPQGNQYILKGEIVFQKDRYPVSESLKLMVGLMD